MTQKMTDYDKYALARKVRLAVWDRLFGRQRMTKEQVESHADYNTACRKETKAYQNLLAKRD